MKNLIKKIYYTGYKSGQLQDYNINLAYIFHTEKIHNDNLFDNLIFFCEEYAKITRVKPICAIIPPTNALLKIEFSQSNFTEEKFISRIRQLEKFAVIGYHGHFYLNNNSSYHNAIHCNSYRKNDLQKQFNLDIQWFEDNHISHNGIYSGGWWFMNQDLIELLLNNQFLYDFSFSKAKYFYNQFSNDIMNMNDIETGDVFCIQSEENNLKCIQNFIGMHTTPFPQDFDRNMINIIEKSTNLVGVVNSHDYDLDVQNTINCIKYQIEKNGIDFQSFESISKHECSKLIKLNN